MTHIGIIGCGTIGSRLAEVIDKEFAGKADVACLCDIDADRAKDLAARLSSAPAIIKLDELVKNADLVIEAASAKVSHWVVNKCLNENTPVMVMSVGGLIGHPDLFRIAEEKRIPVYLPSGAVGGLDAVKAASVGKIKQVVLTTRKPPASLRGAPYLADHNIDLDLIKGETVIFEGSAEEAVSGFPKNINVSAALSFAGIGTEKTMVKIITSPEYRTNSHEICVEGEFGKLRCRTDNVPSPDNPKTSYLAILSAIAKVKDILGAVKVGT